MASRRDMRDAHSSTPGRSIRDNEYSAVMTSKLTLNGSPRVETGTVAPAESTAAAPTAEAKPSIDPTALNLERLAELKEAVPSAGTTVSTTASNEALFDAARQKPLSMAEEKPPLEIMALKSLSKGQRAQKKKALEAEKAQLEGRIGKRAQEVDRRWGYTLLQKRSDTLRAYLSSNTSVPPGARAKVMEELARFDELRHQLDEARAKAKALRPKKSGDAKGGTEEERQALAEQLAQLRKAELAAVDAATQAIDGEGFKIDRLAEAESEIDPKGAETSPHGSLKVMVNRYYEVMFSLEVITELDPVAATLQASTQRMIEAGRREDDKLRDIIMKKWLQRKAMQQKALEQLTLAKATVKATVRRSK